MTPDEQRIAIAEACGWHSFKRITYDDGRTLLWGMSKDMKSTTLPTMLVPDYLNDLNAMHEAEKILEYDWRQPTYLGYIKRIVMRTSETRGCDDFQMSTATAAQRAEAFRRTIGKRRDT